MCLTVDFLVFGGSVRFVMVLVSLVSSHQAGNPLLAAPEQFLTAVCGLMKCYKPDWILFGVWSAVPQPEPGVSVVHL